MSLAFQITQKHYNTIVKQAYDNLPQECGGFLGGDGFTIKAILPLFNWHLYNKTDTFSFTHDDLDRANRFFKKHNLTYYGLYHSHPKGIAYPSQPDIASGQKYHFIISMKDSGNPEFNAFEIIDKSPHYIPINVIADFGFTSIGIHDKEDKKSPSQKMHKNPKEEAEHLGNMIENLRNSQQNEYPKMPPKNDDRSDFSTMA